MNRYFHDNDAYSSDPLDCPHLNYVMRNGYHSV